MNASDAGSVGGGPSMRALVDQIEEMQRNYTSASLALKTEKQRVTARRVEYRAVCDEVQRAYQTVTQLIRAKAKAESELDDLRASGAAGPHDRDTTKAIREHNTRLRHQISAMEKELDAKWAYWSAEAVAKLNPETRVRYDDYRKRWDDELKTKTADLAELERKFQCHIDHNRAEEEAIAKLEFGLAQRVLTIEKMTAENNDLMAQLRTAEAELERKKRANAAAGKPEFSNPQTRKENLLKAIQAEEVERESLIDLKKSLESDLARHEKRGAILLRDQSQQIAGTATAGTPAPTSAVTIVHVNAAAADGPASAAGKRRKAAPKPTAAKAEIDSPLPTPLSTAAAPAAGSTTTTTAAAASAADIEDDGVMVM